MKDDVFIKDVNDGSIHRIYRTETVMDGYKHSYMVLYPQLVEGKEDKPFFCAYIMTESIKEACDANEFELLEEYSPTPANYIRSLFECQITDDEALCIANVLASEDWEIKGSWYYLEIYCDGVSDRFSTSKPDLCSLVNTCLQYQKDWIQECPDETSIDAIQSDIDMLTSILNRLESGEIKC